LAPLPLGVWLVPGADADAEPECDRRVAVEDALGEVEVALGEVTGVVTAVLVVVVLTTVVDVEVVDLGALPVLEPLWEPEELVVVRQLVEPPVPTVKAAEDWERPVLSLMVSSMSVPAGRRSTQVREVFDS